MTVNNRKKKTLRRTLSIASPDGKVGRPKVVESLYQFGVQLPMRDMEFIVGISNGYRGVLARFPYSALSGFEDFGCSDSSKENHHS
jgi:hypothetical protein